jgi:AraC-like DNA-binding protein
VLERRGTEMLNRRVVLDSDAIAIEDFACRHPERRGQAVESSARHAIVLVRRGCFIRSADGVESLLDPTLAYCMNPGEEERFDHPQTNGDDCTTVALDPALVALLWGGEETLPSGPLQIPPGLDLAHRLLLAAGRRGADPDELTERAVTIAAATLEQVDSDRVAAGRPATARARRVLVDGARELLAEEPGCPLPKLARTLAVSPHHLSRIFRVATGDTISRHRRRLRTRAALERLAGGEHDLARLAADVGPIRATSAASCVQRPGRFPPRYVRRSALRRRTERRRCCSELGGVPALRSPPAFTSRSV